MFDLVLLFLCEGFVLFFSHGVGIFFCFVFFSSSVVSFLWDLVFPFFFSDTRF